MFNKFYIFAFSLLLVFQHPVFAFDLQGTLNQNVYESPNGVFSTQLPNLNGEIRDFPNAVSVYDVDTGAQDSLEFFPIPAQELVKYNEIGAEEYHAGFIRDAFVNRRYKKSFDGVHITNEGLSSINNKDVYLTALVMEASHETESGKFSGKQLRILLATVVEGEKMVAFQIAETAESIKGYKKFVERSNQTLIKWLENTTFH